MSHKAFRFFHFFIVPNIAFVAIAYMVPASIMIAIFNGALAAMACGTCVAYFPTIRNLLANTRKIDRADLLALGIFFAWFSIVLRTFWGILWRYNGYPDGWTDTNFSSYYIFLAICGAAFHLVAPGAIGSRVPTIEWVKIGMLVTFGVGSMLLGSWMIGIATPL